jgi:hypothetical protein
MSDFNRQNTNTGSTGTMGSSGSVGTVGGTGTRNFDQYSDTYRSDWNSRYGENKPWDQHRDYYRYGWESAQDSRFRGKEFRDVESDLRSGYDKWYGEHKGHSMDAHSTVGGKVEHVWENFKDTVREGWDRARMEFNR